MFEANSYSNIPADTRPPESIDLKKAKSASGFAQTSNPDALK
jgi:hypothetical protein